MYQLNPAHKHTELLEDQYTGEPSKRYIDDHANRHEPIQFPHETGYISIDHKKLLKGIIRQNGKHLLRKLYYRLCQKIQHFITSFKNQVLRCGSKTGNIQYHNAPS